MDKVNLNVTPRLIKTSKDGRKYVDIKMSTNRKDRSGVDVKGKLYEDGTVDISDGSVIRCMNSGAEQTYVDMRNLYRNKLSNNIVLSTIRFDSLGQASGFVKLKKVGAWDIWANSQNKAVRIYKENNTKIKQMVSVLKNEDYKEQKVDNIDSNDDRKVVEQVSNNSKQGTQIIDKKAVLDLLCIEENMLNRIIKFIYLTNCYGVPTKKEHVDIFVEAFSRMVKNAHGLSMNDASILDKYFEKIFEDAHRSYVNIEINYGRLFYEQLSKDTTGDTPKIVLGGTKDADYESYKLAFRNYVENFKPDKENQQKYKEYGQYLDTFKKGVIETQSIKEDVYEENKHDTTEMDEIQIYEVAVNKVLNKIHTYSGIASIILPKSYNIIDVKLDGGTIIDKNTQKSTGKKLITYLHEIGLLVNDFKEGAQYLDDNRNTHLVKNLFKEDTNAK